VPARGPEPFYGQVLTLTALWYGILTSLCLVWLVSLDNDRRATVGRELLTNLPWFFGALVLSGVIAVVLRWAAISWRAIPTSFAACVIGAGLVTVLHSFAV
jgi:hypothetical protein